MESTEFVEETFDQLNVEQASKLDLLLEKVDQLLEQTAGEVVDQESLGVATVVTPTSLHATSSGIVMTRLAAGTRVQLLQVTGIWVRVRVTTGAVGWLLRATIR